jgi:hypothetical protein
MSAQRAFGIFLLILVIIAALALIWYIGGQKTVYGLTALGL